MTSKSNVVLVSEQLQVLMAAVEELWQALAVQNDILRDRTFGTNREAHHEILSHLTEARFQLDALKD